MHQVRYINAHASRFEPARKVLKFTSGYRVEGQEIDEQSKRLINRDSAKKYNSLELTLLEDNNAETTTVGAMTWVIMRSFILSAGDDGAFTNARRFTARKRLKKISPIPAVHCLKHFCDRRRSPSSAAGKKALDYISRRDTCDVLV